MTRVYPECMWVAHVFCPERLPDSDVLQPLAITAKYTLDTWVYDTSLLRFA